MTTPSAETGRLAQGPHSRFHSRRRLLLVIDHSLDIPREIARLCSGWRSPWRRGREDHEQAPDFDDAGSGGHSLAEATFARLGWESAVFAFVFVAMWHLAADQRFDRALNRARPRSERASMLHQWRASMAWAPCLQDRQRLSKRIVAGEQAGPGSGGRHSEAGSNTVAEQRDISGAMPPSGSSSSSVPHPPSQH